MGYLSVRASRMYLETFRINYEHEQELLAARKRKEGALQWELAHRINVVNLSPPVELPSFLDMNEVWSLEFPLTSLILERISNIPYRYETYKKYKGQKIAMLADTLERLGMKKEAEEKWKEASRFTGHTNIEKTKKMVSMWHKIEDKWIDNEAVNTQLNFDTDYYE